MCAQSCPTLCNPINYSLPGSSVHGIFQARVLEWVPSPSLKKVQTTAQLHSSHMLVTLCSKFSKPGFSNMWTVNFQMFKLVLEKAEETEIKLPTSTGSQKKQENSRKTSTSASLAMLKPLTVWITINWKILKEMGIPDHLICLLRNLYAVQEATVRTGHGTTD